VRRFVLDTSILVRHWRGCRTGKTSAQIKEADASFWAHTLIEIEDTNAIVTPVRLEFVCGVRDQWELSLARAYLKPFQSIDKGKTLVGDWREAQRLAERVPKNGRPRDLGDCLIKAIASRLNYQVRSFDTGMSR
jgi:predicted nucleic acid-binding protein